MANQAWELGFYDLFLLWSGQLLIFATPVTIRCSKALSTVIRLIVAFYSHSKSSFRVQDLMVQVLTEDILQTVGIGAAEFLDESLIQLINRCRPSRLPFISSCSSRSRTPTEICW